MCGYRGHRESLSLLSVCGSEGRVAEIAYAWLGLLLFDTLIFILTIYKTWKIGKQCRQRLVQILVRDGTCLPPQASLFFLMYEHIYPTKVSCITRE